MIRYVPLLSILLTASTVSAQHCYPTQTYATTYQAQPTVVVQQTYPVVTLFVPSFYNGLNPVPAAQPQLAAPAAAPSDCAKTHDLLAQFMARQDKRDEAMFEWMKRTPPPAIQQPMPAGPPPGAGGPSPPTFAQPQVQAVAPTPEQIAKLKTDGLAAGLATCNARCAKCHEAKVAGSIGGGFALLTEGQFAPLSYKSRLDVLKAIRSGAMPKGGSLTDYEHDSIVVAITSLPAPTN